MRKLLITLVLLSTFYFLLSNLTHAQSGISTIDTGQSLSSEDEQRILDLRKQIEKLEEQARQYRSNVAEEQVKSESLKGEISILQNQISHIEIQIYITGKNVDKTKLEISGVEVTISDTQEKINSQKDTIGQLLLSIDRQDNENLLAILLKNESLSDFFRYEQYISSFNSSLLGLVDDLKGTKATLEGQKDSLENKKLDLEIYKRQQNSQRVSLDGIKLGKDNLLLQTKGQEAQYQKLLEDAERRKAAFFTELRELETRIIQGGLYLVHIVADKLPPKGTKIFQWPEDDYRITQGYGWTRYAQRGAYGGSPHNGIDMASGFGSPIKAVGEGEIIANGYNNGWGNWVAIKHQNNLVSVYAHMSSLSFLRVGTHVRAGDTIGLEGFTGNSTGSHLHLSLYREFFTYVNEKNGQLYFNYFQGSVNPLSYL